MEALLERLNRGDVLVSDGAMGTLLFHHGLEAGACPEAMNLSHVEILEKIAGEYFEAGADIVHTNTFGGSAIKLAEYKRSADTEALNAAAVKAIRKAVGTKAYVSGSVGPCGKILQPYGDTDPGVMRESFDRQVSALIEAGVDAVTVETMSDLREAAMVIYAVKAVNPRLPIIATMTFEKTPRGYRTFMGVSVEEAVDVLGDAGANVLGSNCGNGPSGMLDLVRDFRAFWKKPLMIQANAGTPELRNGVTVYPENPLSFATNCQELVNAGANILGGCCGTTPEHIRVLVSRVKSTNQ